MELLSVLPEAVSLSFRTDPEVAGISHDSRKAAPGDLFVAIRGEKADGFDYVGEAVSRGACAIVSDRTRPEGFPVPWVRFSSPRRALGVLSARLAGNPSEKLILAAVTGTNGKTTTAKLLEALLSRRHGKAGFVGTLGYRTASRELLAARTTPEAPLLQSLLAEMVSSGVPAAALEVSSHALALDRVEGCRFDVAVFTNLTPEHLDFHGEMESYFSVKKKLFALRKSGACAVINADDAFGRRLSGELEPPIVTFSPSGGQADFRAMGVRCDLGGIAFETHHPSGRFPIASPLLGRFNVENLLAASAAALSLGMEAEEVAEACGEVRSVPGRLERVEAGQSFPILVDYAHTEDALRRLLLAVRELTDRKITLVFGCGGDRDPGKRGPMGRVAGELSDIAIATSDNPRSEDPEAILAQIEAGLVAAGATKYLKVPDRYQAIRTAIALGNRGTVVVIAGKGHERTQVLGDREIPFDDRAVAAELAGRG